MAFAALVLAAGRGERFGGGKLDAPFRGEPLLAHALRAACAAPVERVLLVTREGQAVPSNDPRLGVLRIDSDSLSASLKAGLAELAGAEAVFVFLGDMPLVPHDLAARLAEAIGDGLAAVPEFDGRPAHPVLLSRRAVALARDLSGDRGLGALLAGRGDVVRLAVDDPGAAADIDTREALARLASSPAIDRMP